MESKLFSLIYLLSFMTKKPCQKQSIKTKNQSLNTIGIIALVFILAKEANLIQISPL